MYAILVKNNQAYDVIGFFSHMKEQVINDLNAAYQTGSPIIGMNANEYKTSALYGATWNGSSFSGGTAGPHLLEVTQEQLDSFDLYAFLCNNVVVARVAVPVSVLKAEMYAAAFTSEVILVKVPEDQSVAIGETYNWDGTSFSTAA